MSKEQFEKWAGDHGYDLTLRVNKIDYHSAATHYASMGYQARQPEIDALRAELERLKALKTSGCEIAGVTTD